MISHKEAMEILTEHDAWVKKRSIVWKLYDAAFHDDAWGPIREMDEDDGEATFAGELRQFANGQPVLMQVNHVKSWVHSYVDSLYHSGLRSVVARDNAVANEEPRDPALVANLIDRWLTSKKLADFTEQLFTMGMMLPNSAIHFGHVDGPMPKQCHPIDRVWVNALPPWECGWDRRARSHEEIRYKFRVQYMPIERVRSMKQWDLPDNLKGENRKVPMESESPGPGRDLPDGGPNFIRVYTFYDLTSEWEAKDEDGNTAKQLGQMRVYLPDQKKVDEHGDIAPVFKGPLEYTDATGKPFAPLLPIVMMPRPEYPLWGHAPVATIYQLNMEINFAHSILANALRTDADRKTLFDKAMFDPDAMNRMTNGKDGEWIPVDLDGEAGGFQRGVYAVPQQPVSNTIQQSLNALERGREATAGTSPNSRGEPTKYTTATQTMSLEAWTETTLGRIRRRMDRALVAACEIFLRVLREVIGAKGEIKVWNHSEVAAIPAEWLDEPWVISMVDEASTPMALAHKREAIAAVLPIIQEHWAGALEGDKMSIAILRVMARLYDLPDDMHVDNLLQQQEQEVEEEEPEEVVDEVPLTGPPVDPMAALPPDQAAMVAEAAAASRGEL